MNDPNSYFCPHCTCDFDATTDDQFADDVLDDCETTCPQCRGKFQLVCTHVDVYFETTVWEATPA